MPKQLKAKLSSSAVTELSSLAKRFGMNRGLALSWVLVETAPPVIPKRGKASRSEDIELHLTDDAFEVLAHIVAAHDSSESIVIEAYLGRDYR